MSSRDKYTNPLTGNFTVDSIKPLDLSNFTKEYLKYYFYLITVFTIFKSESWIRIRFIKRSILK